MAAAVAIVVVFFLPLPHVSLFKRLVAPTSVSTTTTSSSTTTVTTTVPSSRVTPTAVAGAAGYLWLAGTYGCAGGACSALMLSTDGGQSWARVGQPPSSVVLVSPQFSLLNFANRKDGYAHGKQGTPLYWTGDGGRHWQRGPLIGDLYDLVTTGGRAYALWREGGSANYRDFRYYLSVSSISSNSWRTIKLPALTNGQTVFLTAWKSKVWLVVTPLPAAGEAYLLVSSNEFRTFSRVATTGLGGLSSMAVASSFETLWGVATGGSMDGLARSTDGGKRFVAFPEDAAGVAFLPGSLVFPVSDSEALAADSVGFGLFLTHNGGQSFSRVLPRAQILDVGFANGNDWLALGWPNPTAAEPLSTSIWLTITGGRSWQAVKSPDA
ncbi:MAG: hypothetical protein WAV54_02095 [Acidimicrobiales bacterium]